jgi:2-phosphosulfolactate phosphatase
VILATSNGTPAIAAAAPKAGRLLVCSILNVDAVAGAIDGESGLVVICGGNQGRIAGEDLLCAGLLIKALSPAHDPSSLDDPAAIAVSLAEKYGDDIEAYLASTDRGRRLIELGYGKDITYCSRRGAIDRVPELMQGLIEP